MKKILMILKKSWLAILVVIALLVVQARCDLALPDYTSKIINVGIQQKGVESNVPTVIRESEFKKLQMFMSDAEKQQVQDNYRLLAKDTLEKADYDTYVKKYPLLEQENLYLLKDISSDLKDQLATIFSKPMLIVYSINQGGKEMDQMKQQLIAQMGMDIDPASVDLYTLLSNFNHEQLEKMFEEVIEKIEGVQESIITQMNITYVSSEYKTIGIDLEHLQLSYIAQIGAKMVGLSLLIMTITIGVTFLSARIGARFSRDLRAGVVHKVMSFSNKEFNELSSASLITRSTNDIQQIQMLIVMSLRVLIYAPILGFGAIRKVQGSSMSWVIAVAVLAILSLVILLFSFALPKFQKVQKLIDKLNLVSREILTGLPVIRAFRTEKHEERRFEKANADLTKTNLFVNRLMSVMMPTMMFIMNGVSILIIWVGAKKVDLGTMQVGDLLAFITYTMQIIMSFLMISMVSIMLPRAWISVKRIAEVFNKKVSVIDKAKTIPFDESKKGLVEFKDVYFRYPDAEEDILSNISFTAKKGTTTAFIGSTGSGKSTLINLIPRFFDVTGGKILIDGVDIRDVSLEALRNKIGYVPQKGILFSGTIASNIGFGKENMSVDEMKASAQIAQAESFILEKEEQYDSPISQGGTNVSGGQKQRLAIARAIATNPEIYIFDDSFSALDYKTDYNLRKALAKVTKDSTIFIVAQRISTILHADQIVVLDQGEVVGIGTHEELMENCSIYQEIALSQLSKEELDHE